MSAPRSASRNSRRLRRHHGILRRKGHRVAFVGRLPGQSQLCRRGGLSRSGRGEGERRRREREHQDEGMGARRRRHAADRKSVSVYGKLGGYHAKSEGTSNIGASADENN